MPLVRHNFFHRLQCPALSETDFVFIIISAGEIRRWKLPGFHKAPINDDPRQAPYYTDHDQSPYFNQLFAVMCDTAYRKKLLKELEKRYHKHQQGMIKGRRKSKVPSQASTVLPVDEGLLLESGSDSEGGGAPMAAAEAAVH